MPLYEIVQAGGLGSGGFNFDAKLRRQSIDRTDLFHAHVGGIDTLARALLAAAQLHDEGTLATMKTQRYEGWNGPLGQDVMNGSASLAGLAERVESGEIDPRPVSGRQELYENVVNAALWNTP